MSGPNVVTRVLVNDIGADGEVQNFEVFTSSGGHLKFDFLNDREESFRRLYFLCCHARISVLRDTDEFIGKVLRPLEPQP